MIERGAAVSRRFRALADQLDQLLLEVLELYEAASNFRELFLRQLQGSLAGMLTLQL